MGYQMAQNPWVRLSTLCESLNAVLREGADRQTLVFRATELQTLLQAVPADDESILGAEARAIVAEIRGDYEQAIVQRRVEVERRHRLLIDVETQQYDESVRNAILRGHGSDELLACLADIARLQNRQLNERL